MRESAYHSASDWRQFQTAPLQFGTECSFRYQAVPNRPVLRQSLPSRETAHYRSDTQCPIFFLPRQLEECRSSTAHFTAYGMTHDMRVPQCFLHAETLAGAMYVHAIRFRDWLIATIGNTLIFLIDQRNVVRQISIENENGREAMRNPIVEGCIIARRP